MQTKTTHIGLMGYGKIGRALAEEIVARPGAELNVIQDPLYQGEAPAPVVPKFSPDSLEPLDLVVECATADVLKAGIEDILANCDLMLFSVTAFSDPDFQQKVETLCAQYGRRVYLPHGAILGLDGLFDGRSLIHSVSIETTKSPASLGRTDTERTVLYEGPTRQACQLYPRNVNVHAAVALAGLGFEKTVSRIVADPAVHTNTHIITVEGEGIHFSITVSSTAFGGVTGAYTPVSARGSLRRVLGQAAGLCFV